MGDGKWLVLLCACGGSSPSEVPRDSALNGDGGDGNSGLSLVLPDINARVDYQLGGPYAPPTGVTVVSRDRTAPAAAGLYNICYVNGFQIQPDEEMFWLDDHPTLILRDTGGQPIIDVDWNEMLIDVSTPAKRTEVAAIVAGWIGGCADNGFAAVEIDNLDSYTRSAGGLTEANAVATMQLFADAAHARGLAIAQKNAAEMAVLKPELRTDFVVAEECNRYNECAVYTGEYGDHVIVIEYRQQDFDVGCTAFPGLSITLRDLDVSPLGTAGYVFDDC